MLSFTRVINTAKERRTVTEKETRSPLSNGIINTKQSRTHRRMIGIITLRIK